MKEEIEEIFEKYYFQMYEYFILKEINAEGLHDNYDEYWESFWSDMRDLEIKYKLDVRIDIIINSPLNHTYKLCDSWNSVIKI